MNPIKEVYNYFESMVNPYNIIATKYNYNVEPIESLEEQVEEPIVEPIINTYMVDVLTKEEYIEDSSIYEVASGITSAMTVSQYNYYIRGVTSG